MDVAAAAAQVLAEVLDKRAPLPLALSRQRVRFNNVGHQPLLQELCYGTLRWLPRLEAIMEQLLSRPLNRLNREVACLLATGLYRLDYMNIPDHAAVHLTVEGCAQIRKPWARRVVNAALRRYLRERRRIGLRLSHSRVAQYAHPNWLIEAIAGAWPEDWERILAAGNTRPPLCLRVNRRRAKPHACQTELARAGIRAKPVPHCPYALSIDGSVPVSALPGFAEGHLSVQDAAAQLATALLEPAPAERVLDACSAPGGKSGAILEHTVPLRLWCLDRSETRLGQVRENLARLGLTAHVVSGDLRSPRDWWDGMHYDRILLDVPCSATGVIRRNPDIKMARTVDDIRQAAVVQTELLEAAWQLLAPGGRLVYASCSILSEENEQPLGNFLQRHTDAHSLPICAAWGRPRGPGRQILPGWQDMDGFYYAVLKKLRWQPAWN